MILTCPACHTRYSVDPEKFPASGRNVRCARCGEVWHAYADVTPAPEPPSFAYDEPQTDSFARDQQPHVEDGVYEEEEKPRALWPRRIALSTGWLALGAVVIVIGVVATEYRQQVVAAWPQSASLYSTLGMKVNATGLDIHSIKYTEAPQDGQVVLTVSGALTNVTSHELPVPQIRVGLVDSDKRELYHWTFAPEVMTLRPGQSTRFVTRLSNPPQQAADAQVRFAKAGE